MHLRDRSTSSDLEASSAPSAAAAGKQTRTEAGEVSASPVAPAKAASTGATQRMPDWDPSSLTAAMGLGGEDGGGGGGGDEPSAEELESSGQPLDAAVREKMEQQFGTSFASVRIHTDAKAAAVVASRGARAFTYKNHIAFAEGAYDPGSPAGEALLVHELTHVAQAGGATSDKAKVPKASAADGAHEAQADRNAKRSQERGGGASTPGPGSTAGEIAAHLAGGGEVASLGLPNVAAGEAAARRFGQDPRALYESDASVDPERRHQCSGGTPPATMTLSPVTITVTQAPLALTQRGSAEYKVRWSVGGGKNGWVIQHVRFRPAIKNAAGADIAAKNISLEYWEAWQVRNGSVFVGSSASAHSADTFRTISEDPNTKGQVDVIGKVAFVEGYDLQEPPWGHTVAPAGALPTMTSAPAGWSDGSAQDHTMRVNYDDVAKTPQTQVGNP
ncbi:MAG: DUF4157 domain-containing protein [Kofleriaceae bacterium]